MFSNAKSVEINGKEVKSIILENGAILYKKDESYLLSVTSDKNILSHYDNDVATLTATLTQGGVPVEGEEVKFYITEDIPAGLSFTGTNFTVSSSSSGLSGNNIVIDWGDGSTTTYTGVSSLNHTYSEIGNYFITITGVTSLERSCFRECSGLTSVVIPEGITSIKNACFWDCSSLTSVVIPEGVTSLGSSCFDSCSSLTSIVIPDSVTSLGDYCFYGCSGLTSVVIPEGITSIENACFWDCSSLTSVVIPDSVTSFGDACFRNCSSLTSLVCSWTTNPPTFNSSWISDVHSSFKFSIPNGTTQVYIDAGYPSDKIVERSE